MSKKVLAALFSAFVLATYGTIKLRACPEGVCYSHDANGKFKECCIDGDKCDQEIDPDTKACVIATGNCCTPP
jgi:hypothetical protein